MAVPPCYRSNRLARLLEEALSCVVVVVAAAAVVVVDVVAVALKVAVAVVVVIVDTAAVVVAAAASAAAVATGPKTAPPSQALTSTRTKGPRGSDSLRRPAAPESGAFSPSATPPALAFYRKQQEGN